MISIKFEEREKIGLQYILESLHGCSPFGQERIRRLRYYTPDERQELEQELRNVERAAAHAGELKDLYDQICVVLCQMKDIRGSLRRCRELEVPDHVELFELKGYLQRLETLRPLFEKYRGTDFHIQNCVAHGRSALRNRESAIAAPLFRQLPQWSNLLRHDTLRMTKFVCSAVPLPSAGSTHPQAAGPACKEENHGKKRNRWSVRRPHLGHQRKPGRRV